MTPEGAVGAPAVSVVVCVYTEDRWADILAAVDSVRAQSCPAREILLVVDHHQALLDRLAAEYATEPAVRVLANSGPRGLSAGRNTGIEASDGEIIAFLDDDAVAERDWLRHFVAAYEDPLVLAVGGRTEPAWETGRRPVWFPEEFDWAVGCMYRGHPRGRVQVRNVLGGNASFRRTAFEAAGGFATGIGRDGTRLPLGCEETELCIRLRRALPGAVLLIDDRAVIHHRVPASRARVSYLRTRAFAEGISKAHVSRLVGAQDGLATERAYTTRVLPLGVLRGLRDAALGRPGGLARAGAIVLGAGAAAAGYATAALSPEPRGAVVPEGPGAAGPEGAAPGDVGAAPGDVGVAPGDVGAAPGDVGVAPGDVGTEGAAAGGPAAEGAAPPARAAGQAEPRGVPKRNRSRGLRRAASGSGPVPVLMYHAVADRPAKAAYGLSVTPAAFGRQMEVLEELDFTPVTTGELGAAWRSGAALPRRPVLITFDDGYEGVHTHALPTLAKHGFRASLFVSTGWLRGPYDMGGGLDTMLTWDQVRELADGGLEIGGHSHTHPQLDQVGDDALAHEIGYCRELVAAETGTAPVSFAYPYGYSSRRVRAAVRAAGFGQALAVNNALAARGQGPYALTRLTVRRGTDEAEFARLVEGRALGPNFARDRVLGKGYAVVRRARRAATVLGARSGTDHGSRGSRDT